ncbi:MAG TPA: NAD(P)/FAD-dependent oxidoreductase [Nitrososphaeraceae archaeon]|nr:NAD(P)/FAD-dependent oxidoreductase [Nitrososphaeraceae archaeon]
MRTKYDVIIAGGSISGLLTAREIGSESSISVKVLEADHEIGTPEHCGGLVSLSGLRKLGVVPSYRTFRNRIMQARLCSRFSSLMVDARLQDVVAIDRRELDKQIAFQAQELGVEITTMNSVRGVLAKSLENGYSYEVSTTEGTVYCKYFVDARGLSSLIRRHRTGILPSGQYEVFAPWIDPDTVELYFDVEKFPGFFAWIIPLEKNKAKIGVAGRGINVVESMDSFLKSKGSSYSISRKIFAPIHVSGPIRQFVEGRFLTVGDAAGQTKPTTAGGILTSGMGGILAGRALAKAIEEEDDSFLERYPSEWHSIFGFEFKKLILARKIFEHLDNKAIDELFSTVSSSTLYRISHDGEFDFHSAPLSLILNAKSTSKIFKGLLESRLRKVR